MACLSPCIIATLPSGTRYEGTSEMTVEAGYAFPIFFSAFVFRCGRVGDPGRIHSPCLISLPPGDLLFVSAKEREGIETLSLIRTLTRG